MNLRDPFLAMIGYATTGKDTTGKDDVERGVHLRWQFRREMGFPLGCFRLYRRLSGEYGTLVCLDFEKMLVSEKRKPFNVGSKLKPVLISSSRWPLALESRRVSGDRRRTILERVLSIPEAELEITLPEYAYFVKVRANFKAHGTITLFAYFEDLEVGRSSISPHSAGIYWVGAKASAIDKVILKARSVDLVQVCYILCERCEDHEEGNWQQIDAPICMPIDYPGKPGKDPHREPECEWLNVEDRLPKDPCVLARYGGENAKELVSVLRTLISPESITTQADRLIEAVTLPDDCPPPGQESPDIYFPAIDAILMAAIDPIVAKVVGLYFIDKNIEEGKNYDYKIEGFWPYGTLWQLSNCLKFDDYPLRHRFFLNIFAINELTFRSSIRPTLIDEPSKSARTEKALAFLETDDRDWNFPNLDNLPFSLADHLVEIRFPQPVGEVQIHLGQRTPNVALEAWDDDRNRRVDVLEGEVTNIGPESNGRISVDVRIKELDVVPANLLVRKILKQPGKSFQILSNSTGSPDALGLNVSLVLRLEPIVLSRPPIISLPTDISHPIIINRPTIGNCIIEPKRSTRREDILAIHGFQSTDQITRIVLKGRDFWLYKICWQQERIPHGTHCAFIYGLKMEDAEPLKPPLNVKAIALPGMVKKVADCQPLLEGETLDARYSLGLSWELPLVNDQLLPKSPIRYHINRINQNGEETLLTEDNPTLVTPILPEIKEAHLKNLPEGWPEDPSLYIDSGLEPGAYQYRVAGIDLFGRISSYSIPSSAVEPKPPPPPIPANVYAYFIDRQDPWLSSDDINTLPNGIDGAIRLRWIWSEQLERMSPDVQSFKVHYTPSIPNVLLGEVTNIHPESDGLVQLTTKVVGLNSAPKNLLSGRLLFQSGKAFRILTHSEGTGNESSQEITFELRLPPHPSKNRPVLGAFSVALDASIPVDVTSLSTSNEEIKTTIKTTALKAIPSSGLQNGVLIAGGIETTIKEVTSSELSNGILEVEMLLKLSDPNQKSLFSNIPAPFYAKLSLPPPNTIVYKDYSNPNSWPINFIATIPKTIVGHYDLIIRKKVSGEANGLTSTGAGKYILIIDELPQGLTKNEVDFDNPRGEGHFALSCVGPGGQGRVSFPAGVIRLYRGDKAKQDEVLTSLKPPIGPEDFVLEGPPNFEGKLRYEFSWNKTNGWRYEVYRTLDDTLFKVDSSIRDDIATGKILPRFPNEPDKQNWLNNFQLSGAPDLHSVIESLVIDPQAIDLTAIESHNYRNILLQALASLPINDRAFTRLDLDSKHLKVGEIDPTKMICIDDTIEGRAKGRYFYRVQAIDSVGNRTSMGISTQSICVRGDLVPDTPIITAIEGGDNQITIRWSAIQDPDIKGYLLHRTDDKIKTIDVRLMDIIKQNPSDDYSVRVPDLLPTEFVYMDSSIVPEKRYFYCVVAINENRVRSRSSNILSGMAFDYSQPDEPNWIRTEWIKLDENNIEHLWSDTNPNLTPIIILEFSATKSNVFTLVKRKEAGEEYKNVSKWINEAVFDEVDSVWKFKFYDKTSNPNKEYTYRLKLMNSAGLFLDSMIEQTVPIPGGI